VCLPFVEYLPVRETAAPKIILSPSTFENDVEVVPKISPKVERRTNVNLIILFIIFPLK
jgi:hypothetical protein